MKKKKLIKKGIAQEEINACMPIFINKSHWEISKNLMKPILGWIVTLDPAGYNYDQIKTIPFLLLHKILIEKSQNLENEFMEKMFRHLKLTCMNIFIEDEKEFKNNETQKVGNYN